MNEDKKNNKFSVKPYIKSDNEEFFIPPTKASSHSKSSGYEKRTSNKFIPLFNKDGNLKTAAQIPGRNPCECQAAKHDLINNCVGCGRVVCLQEGAGPCLFCGELVCTKEDEVILQRNSKKSEKLRSSLMAISGGGILKAIEHKNRLLEYDQSCAKRTRVIDDESDYFSTGVGSWLSKEQREKVAETEKKLRDDRFSLRRQQKILLDFSSSKLDIKYQENDNRACNVYSDLEIFNKHLLENENKIDSEMSIISNRKNVSYVPKMPINNNTKANTVIKMPARVSKLKIQDCLQQEMFDAGMCLSMHQPWASLLIRGIKLHEGRSWYSAHRGRLWIASTAKLPNEKEINEMQSFYENHYGTPSELFPETFPESCLLGCVDVVEVLHQSDYREKYKEGESDSEYVFICENPRELAIKFSIKGKHKIYKLESNLLKSAQKGLDVKII